MDEWRLTGEEQRRSVDRNVLRGDVGGKGKIQLNQPNSLPAAGRPGGATSPGARGAGDLDQIQKVMRP